MFLLINNHCPEDVIVFINNFKYELPANSSIRCATEHSSISCQLIHSQSTLDWRDKLFEKILKVGAEITAIIVDSVYIISQFQEDAVINITNEIFVYEKDDVCIVYYGVAAKNAKIELKDCYSTNAKKFMSARKLLLLNDVNDFPIISPIISAFRYNRIRRILSRNNLWQLVCNKTIFTL